MLTELTKEQEALLPIVRDEWIAIGLSTEPADRPRAEAGVALAYQAANLPPPKEIVWELSPRAGAERAKALSGKSGGAVYGQHDAGWLSFYDAMGRFGIDVSRLHGLMEVAKSSGWWWPLSDAAVLTDRPDRLHRDEQGRLHNETGPAIRYRDGFAVYAVHGVRVPAKVVEAPETLTAAEITAERNAEVRRVMVNRFGFDRYIREAGAKKVATDDWGTLWKMRQPGDEDILAVEVLNSTPEPDGTYKTYFIRTHPECAPFGLGGVIGERQPLTPLNGIAASFGMTGAEYARVHAQT